MKALELSRRASASQRSASRASHRQTIQQAEAERHDHRRVKELAGHELRRRHHEGPQRVGECLHALDDVPARAESVNQVVAYAEGDERIVADPRVRDEHDREHHGGHHERSS